MTPLLSPHIIIAKLPVLVRGGVSSLRSGYPWESSTSSYGLQGFRERLPCPQDNSVSVDCLDEEALPYRSEIPGADHRLKVACNPLPGNFRISRRCLRCLPNPLIRCLSDRSDDWFDGNSSISSVSSVRRWQQREDQQIDIAGFGIIE